MAMTTSEAMPASIALSWTNPGIMVADFLVQAAVAQMWQLLDITAGVLAY